MRIMDDFDYQAEDLLHQLIEAETEDRTKAVDLLGQALRSGDIEGYNRGVRYKVFIADPSLKSDLWVVQRKPLNKPDSKYRLLEAKKNKKSAADAAAYYNSFVADCEYRAFKYVPAAEE